MFAANRGDAEILDTSDLSQWNHVSGINNPADIGTKADYVDQRKRNDWLTGPACLKHPLNECPEQVNLEFVSDKENEETAFISTTNEKEPIVQWELFSNFNRLAKNNGMACAASIEQNEKGNKDNWR